MYKTLFEINLPGLKAKINWSGVIGLGIIGLILLVIMVGFKDIGFGSAFFGALVGAILHYGLIILHQTGHAIAARQTGYPMAFTRSFWLLSASVYPRDEPELPAEVHIKRALGGQYFSFPIFLIAVVVAQAILPDHSVKGVLAVFFLIDAGMFTFVALLPTPFIELDGTTIMRWWPKRGQTP